MSSWFDLCKQCGKVAECHRPKEKCPFNYRPTDQGHGVRAEAFELLYKCAESCKHDHEFVPETTNDY